MRTIMNHGSNAKFLYLIFCFTFIAALIVKANYSFIQIFFFFKRNPTLIFLSVTSVLAFLSWRTQRHLTKAKHTMDFQVSFSDSETMKKAAKTFHTRLCKMTSEEIVSLAAMRHPAKHHAHVVQILNAWERVAVALKHDVYDEEMLYDIYGTFLLKLCSTLSPFINYRQEENPKVFVNLKWLAMKWQVRRCASNDKAERVRVKAEYKSSLKKMLD